MKIEELLDQIRGKLIVSCQAGVGHPLRDSATIARLAQAAVAGGAVAIRGGGVGGLADVEALRAAVTVPLIGLTKDGSDEVYITPTVSAVQQVARAGAEVVAVDGTRRTQPDARPLSDSVDAAHDLGALVMADVASVADAIDAAAAGADLIGTTLAGYTGGPVPDGPDLELVRAIRLELPDRPVIAEGRYHRPDQAAAAMNAGATAIVVGTAITDPAWITGQFAAAVMR